VVRNAGNSSLDSIQPHGISSTAIKGTINRGIMLMTNKVL